MASKKTKKNKATKKATKPRKAATKSSDPGTAAQRIEKRIRDLGDWRGERLAQIRKLIHEVDRDVIEEWKWMGTPVWSNNGMYALANPHKGKVKLQFFHGAQLPDPKKLFNAGLGGGKWRAIDFFEGDKLNQPALKALLRAALAYNKKHSVPKSKGSRATTPTKRVAKQPILLSGGNPQIAKADGDAPVQAYIAALPGWKLDVGRRLDTLIVRTVPKVQKAVRWNSPFYGIKGQGWFLGVHCFNKYIKLTFLRGTTLRPLPPIASKDPNTRYFHLHEGEQVDTPQLTKWIRQAAATPGDPLF